LLNDFWSYLTDKVNDNCNYSIWALAKLEMFRCHIDLKVNMLDLKNYVLRNCFPFDFPSRTLFYYHVLCYFHQQNHQLFIHVDHTSGPGGWLMFETLLIYLLLFFWIPTFQERFLLKNRNLVPMSHAYMIYLLGYDMEFYFFRP